MSARRKLKAFVYRVVRPIFVADVDPNEDFVCTICSTPVLFRHLTCRRGECRTIARNIF
jgi:hypothetical protein